MATPIIQLYLLTTLMQQKVTTAPWDASRLAATEISHMASFRNSGTGGALATSTTADQDTLVDMIQGHRVCEQLLGGSVCGDVSDARYRSPGNGA